VLFKLIVGIFLLPIAFIALAILAALSDQTEPPHSEGVEEAAPAAFVLPSDGAADTAASGASE
jgi:hypothetical protein